MIMEKSGNGSTDRPTGKTFYLGIALATAMLIWLVAVSQSSVARISSALSTVREHADLQQRLVSRASEQAEWATALAADGIPPAAAPPGRLDAAQSRLGKWYAAYTPPAEVEEAFQKVGDSHRRLRSAGARVEAALQEGKTDLAMSIRREEMLPALADTQAALLRMRAGLGVLIDREMVTVDRLQGKMETTAWLLSLGMLGILVGMAFQARTFTRAIHQGSAPGEPEAPTATVSSATQPVAAPLGEGDPRLASSLRSTATL
jgi:hypothetical protein